MGMPQVATKKDIQMAKKREKSKQRARENTKPSESQACTQNRERKATRVSDKSSDPKKTFRVKQHLTHTTDTHTHTTTADTHTHTTTHTHTHRTPSPITPH